MGRDKRQYRFVQDTRNGRIVIAESHEVGAIVQAVTDYVARRMVERERAFSPPPLASTAAVVAPQKRRRGRGLLLFLLGFIVGALALVGMALYAALYQL